MSTYEPKQLLHLWQLEQMDSEMIIGHLLQNLVVQHEAMKKVNLSLMRLQLDLDNLAQQGKSQSTSKSLRKD